MYSPDFGELTEFFESNAQSYPQILWVTFVGNLNALSTFLCGVRLLGAVGGKTDTTACLVDQKFTVTAVQLVVTR